MNLLASYRIRVARINLKQRAKADLLHDANRLLAGFAAHNGRCELVDDLAQEDHLAANVIA